MIVRRGRNIGK